MSASAFHIAKINGQIIAAFASDGASYRIKDGEPVIVSKKARKVIKISPSTALIWMGARVDPLWRITKPLSGLNAEQVIKNLAGQLKEIFHAPEMKAHLVDYPFNLHAFDMVDSGLEYWRLHSKDNYEPQYQGILEPGISAAKVVKDPEGLSFQRWIEKAKPSLNGRSFDTYEEFLLTLTRTAFQMMIDNYSGQGYPVGGEIFTETITKP